MGETVFFYSGERQSCVFVLICRQSFHTIKSYNLKRHHQQNHNEIAKLNASDRNTKLQVLKSNLQSQQNIFHKAASEDKAVVNASLRISQIIAKKNEALFRW